MKQIYNGYKVQRCLYTVNAKLCSSRIQEPSHEILAQGTTHGHHRVRRVKPGAVDLIEVLLRVTRLLRQAVVVLLDPMPGLYEA